MMNKAIKTFYFSATGATKKIADAIAGELAKRFGVQSDRTSS